MNTNFEIQLATLRDAVQIAEMSKTDIEYGFPWKWTPSRVIQAIADSTTNVAVIREQSLVIAFGIMQYEAHAAHLELFAVHRSRRRTGLGSALLAWLEQVARVAGISTIRVEARKENSIARAFYRKHGYLEIADVVGMYHGLYDVEDGVRFEKILLSGTGFADLSAPT